MLLRQRRSRSPRARTRPRPSSVPLFHWSSFLPLSIFLLPDTDAVIHDAVQFAVCRLLVLRHSCDFTLWSVVARCLVRAFLQPCALVQMGTTGSGDKRHSNDLRRAFQRYRTFVSVLTSLNTFPLSEECLARRLPAETRHWSSTTGVNFAEQRVN